MDAYQTKAAVEMSVSLAELVAKGTASAVTKKIKAIQDERNTERLRTTYDELMNEVILEREEAVRIAQAYKAELDRIVISDKDIEHLHATVSKVLEIVTAMQMSAATMKSPEALEKAKTDAQTFQMIKNMISVDTLKTMQLLGFNYKEAIGEPLTKICANAISNLGVKNNIKTNGRNK